MNAIVGIKELGMTLPWDYDDLGRADTFGKGSSIELTFRRFVLPRGVKYKFRIGHVILSIYKAVNLMAAESAFCNAEVTVALHGQRVGIVTISKRLYAPGFIVGNRTDVVLKTTNEQGQDDGVPPTGGIETPARLSRRTNPYGFPEIIEPGDPLFKITYNFNGPPIPKEHVLSAMLDAMVSIAKLGGLTRFDSLDAYGNSGSNTMIHVSRYEDPSNPIRYNSVARALTLIWDNLMRGHDIWAEVSFDVWYGTTPFATGFVMTMKTGTDSPAIGTS